MKNYAMRPLALRAEAKKQLKKDDGKNGALYRALSRAGRREMESQTIRNWKKT